MMKKDTAFQPGKFTPVVEVSQRNSGVPAPADSNFAGLEEVASTTLTVSLASSRGLGAVIPDPVMISRLALVIGHVLAARNIAEQLQFINVFIRTGNALRNARVTCLEPIVRAYNYYGHFEFNEKTYVTRGLERLLVQYLFSLRQYATPEVANGTKQTVTAPNALEDIDIDFYGITPSGDIGFTRRYDLKAYLLRLVNYITNWDDLTNDVKLPLLRDVLDVTTEDGLRQMLRHLRTLPGFQQPPDAFANDPTDKHKSAMKKLFGDSYSNDGDVIPVSKFTSAISHAYALLRRVSLERSYAMKTTEFPRYEGGSATQLAHHLDDVLSSEVPLPMTDSTAALAFTTSWRSVRRFVSAPGLERDELLRELVSQSLIRQ
uniref:Uncharacterized protein n=1 Tax=Macrophomina phaseolina partitivirus 1 TaxID=2741649 RepID=A0A7S6BD52_9VIRU|nr:hypothetical protein [Macrophomina phaseolina partitivirus 1]